MYDPSIVWLKVMNLIWAMGLTRLAMGCNSGVDTYGKTFVCDVYDKVYFDKKKKLVKSYNSKIL